LNSNTLILGTRGSELALRQTEMVMAALREARPSLGVTRKIIATTGDKRTDLRFSEFTEGGRLDKGIFTKELEIALAAGEIDAAVHSLKDVPTELDSAFVIAATLPRAPIEDVLVSREGFDLATLPPGSKIGTSSVRRIRQLRWLRPDVTCVEIRGNVPTRVKKLIQPSGLDGVLLARAGLERLGLLRGTGLQPVCSPGILPVVIDGSKLLASILPCADFLPAAGQGAIGIEARRADARTLDLLSAVNHADTFARVTAERAFLHLLKAGCQTPIGAHTWIEGAMLHMKIRVFNENDPGAPPLEAAASAPLAEPEKAAAELAALVGRD
jgi:hydroxymethylbilane synthase